VYYAVRTLYRKMKQSDSVYLVGVDTAAAETAASCAGDSAADDIVFCLDLPLDPVPMTLDESVDHATHLC